LAVLTVVLRISVIFLVVLVGY